MDKELTDFVMSINNMILSLELKRPELVNRGFEITEDLELDFDVALKRLLRIQHQIMNLKRREYENNT